MIEIIPPKIDTNKGKRQPKNLWRENMHRHITRRKRRKGAHLGLVQALRKRNKR